MNTWFKRMGIGLISLLLITGTSQLFAQSASSSASGSFSLQGMLTNTSGTAVANGQHTVTVNVYPQGSSTSIYSQTSAVTTLGGIFSMMVGDSGTSGSKLTLTPNGSYSVGISVDGGAQLQPMLQLGSAPSAITSQVSATAGLADSATTALNAKTVGGFNVSATGGANTIPVLNSQGLIPANLLPVGISGSGVTSVNGMTGNVVLEGTGNLSLNYNGDTINLGLSGSGGSLTFPYTQSLSQASGTGFNLTNSLGGTVASFSNTGTGNALSLNASGGNALSATGSSSTPVINVSNTAGAALNATSSTTNAIVATTNATGSAALQLKTTASTGAQQLLQAVNASGTTVANLSTTGLLLNGSASGSGSAVLVLQNSATNNAGNLLSAVNANDSNIFSVGTNGSTAINSSASNAALTVNSASNTAISATGSSSSSTGSALVKLQNTSSDTAGLLLSAANSTGTTVLSVANNGAARIASTANTALSVASSASNGIALQASDSATGGTAARLTGGLSLIGPVGTATLSAGNLTQTISNAYAKANSIILITVNSTVSNLTSGLRITGQGSGSFTVGLLALTALTSDLTFNYLIINQ